MSRQCITLLLSIVSALCVHAQTKPNTNRSSPKTTTTAKTKTAQSAKADTTAKNVVTASTAAEPKQPAAAAPAQATTQSTFTPVVKAVVKDAAKPTPIAEIPSPFERGTLRVSHQSMITLERYKRKEGVSPGKDNSLEGSLGVTWFPVKGLGIGVDARYYDSYYTTPGTSSDFSSWSAYFHLMYGYAFNERYHAYVKAGYGPSKSNSKTSLGLNKQELLSSFKDLAFSAGAPIRIENQGRLFVTPSISYDQYKGNAGTHDIKDKTIGLFIKLESYLPLAADGKKEPVNYYAKGTQYLDYNSQLSLYNTTREEYQGTIMFAPRKYNTRFFHVGYGLYVLDNIAAGLDLEFNQRKDKNPGSPDDVRTSFAIKPSVMAQLPVEGPLNHLFAQVAYEFSRGTQSGSVKTKESILDLRIGYHLFVARNLALTPRIGYTMDKYTATYVTSGSIPTKSKGLAGELMLRAWLDWKWMK